ncbi:hypothetical protein OKW45_005784 [Paraburkholderia sp. WSM4175]|uniref:hypothetical protein n=1 Tax=Paraburkholderia sp. WSM4175 TaxID=2991072 RepID=UPI003D239BAF
MPTRPGELLLLANLTGIAAMTGLLPKSRAVTPPLSQTAAVAAQPASTPLDSAQPYAEQQGTRTNTVSEPHVHHHHSSASSPAPRYAHDDIYRNATQPPPRPVAVDPNAGEVVAVNAVQTQEPTTGLGAVGGSVAGGLLGNQVGQGMKRTFILCIAGVSAACTSGAALAYVDLGVYLGAPGPVYVAPPPVVYEAPPVTYVPAPAYGYGYGYGYEYNDDRDRHWHHDHGWHRAGSTIIVTGTMTNNLALHPIRDIAALF